VVLILRKIFGHEREEVTSGWRKLHKKDLLKFSSPNIRVIKLRRMRWVGYVAHKRDKKGIQNFS
jgi:hypothetical protein